MKRQTSSETSNANQNHDLRHFAEVKAPSALAKSSTFTTGRASLLKLILAAFCIATFALPAYAQTCLAGNWRLDEGLGDVIGDSSGNGNDGRRGVAPNNPTSIPGRFGSALRFDGNDFVRVPNSPTLEPATVTVEAWVRHLGYPGNLGGPGVPAQPVSYIVAKGGAWGASSASYALYSRGGLHFYVSTRSGYHLSPDAGAGVWDGEWHYVVGTYDGSAVRLFVDGREVGSGTPLTEPITYHALPPHELTIGSYGDPTAWGSAQPFIGDIDEVKVWGCALSPCEIAEAYRRTMAAASVSPGFDVMTTLRAAGAFSIFVSLLEESNLAQALRQEKELTIFAPNDAAFASLPKGTLDALRQDPDKLRALLGRHILRGRLALGRLAYASLIPPVPRLTNLNGAAIQSIDLRCDIAGCRLGADGEARIIRADVEAGNGFINETDYVMFRPIFVP